MVGLVVAATAVAAGESGLDPAMRPLPLGAVTRLEEGRGRFGVFVPTRFGGVLTVSASSGTVGTIEGPDGRTTASGEDVGPGAPGWYTFAIVGAEPGAEVSAGFVQEGRSAREPWNFYYWPTKADSIHEPWADGNGVVDVVAVMGDDVLVAKPGEAVAPGRDIVLAGPNGVLETPVPPGDTSTWFPNLFDDARFQGADGSVFEVPCPLLKHDLLFGTPSRAWEAANDQSQGEARWTGHCLGGAVASIMLNEPIPAPGCGLTRDELKALWAELGEEATNHRIGEHVVDIAAGPPVPGPDPCDPFVAPVHRLLEEKLVGLGRPLLGNLRAFPPRGTTGEVWNHGIGRCSASYSGLPGRDPRIVRVDVEIEANSGASLNGEGDEPRLVGYAYTLAYDRDGRVDMARLDACDWIAVEGDALYAPLNLMEVEATRWVGRNPYVTEASVRSIDLANGGGQTPRHVAAPPPTASVAASAPAEPTRGGLARRLGRR
jgi:hypothetical protein